MTKQEVIKELKVKGITFDENSSYIELKKLLKTSEPAETQPTTQAEGGVDAKPEVSVEDKLTPAQRAFVNKVKKQHAHNPNLEAMIKELEENPHRIN